MTTKFKIGDKVFYKSNTLFDSNYYVFEIIGETPKFWKIKGLDYTNLENYVDKKHNCIRGQPYTYVYHLTDEIQANINWRKEKNEHFMEIHNFRKANFKFENKEDLRNFVKKLKELRLKYCK